MFLEESSTTERSNYIVEFIWWFGNILFMAIEGHNLEDLQFKGRIPLMAAFSM